MKPKSKLYLILSFFLILILLLVNAGFGAYFYNDIKAQSQIKFEAETQDINDVIQNKLDIYTSVLDSTQGFFASSDNVTRAEYTSYFHSIDVVGNYAGISAISFAERIQNAEKESFTQSVRLDTSINPLGYPNFTTTTDSEKSEYYFIKYIEPFNETSTTFGLDVTSNPQRFEALKVARDSGKPFSTGAVTLLGTNPAKGFLIYVPIYKPNTVQMDITARQENVIGALSGIFNVDTLFEEIFETSSFEGINFKVFDGEVTTDEHLLYDRGGQTEGSVQSATKQIDVAGRNWKIIYTANSNYGLSGFERALPVIVSVLGFSLTLLVVSVLYFLTTSRQRAVKIAESMTQKLSKNEESLKTVVSGIPVILFAIDKKGIFTLFEGKGLSSIDLIAQEGLGRSIFDFFKDQTQLLEDVKKALNGEEFTETRSIKNKLFETKYSPVKTDFGVDGVIIVAVDVTERVNYENELKTQKDEFERMNKTMIDRELKMVELKEKVDNLTKSQGNG